MRKFAQGFDNPWKEALFKKFEAFMLYFFPEAHAAIDWRRKPVFLETELRKISKKAKSGKRQADALVKVFLKDGREQWVLVHIEIQSQRDPKFAERMYIYNYRIFELYKQRVASFAILADENEDWRPHEYASEFLGTRNCFQFATVKLLDYRKDIEVLETHPNPFARVVLAHLKTQETRRDPVQRLTWKVRLLRFISLTNWNSEVKEILVEVIDWMMGLPDNLQKTFDIASAELEEPKNMPFVTTWEKRGRRDGIEIGLKRGEQKVHREVKELLRGNIIDMLEVRFCAVPAQLRHAVEKVRSLTKLKALAKLAKEVSSLDGFKI